MATEAPVDPACARRVASFWPAVIAKLGERRPMFEATVQQRAAAHGLGDPASAARYLNLCLAFGPGFEDKPEHEWALALLVDQRLAPPVKLHQLVLRALKELARRKVDDRALRSADLAVLEMMDAERLRADSDATPMPRQACDVEAVELRLLEGQWRLEYQRKDGQWQRLPATLPAPLRIDANHPAPPTVTVLTGGAGDAGQARLQVRQVAHGHCGQGLHPALRWLGEHGYTAWTGHEARSAAWLLPHTLPAEPAQLLREGAPSVSLLHVSSCGLRDEGVPLEGVKVQLWAYPAHQWLYGLERKALLGYELPDPKSAPPAVEPSRVRLERDGLHQGAEHWLQGFDHDLREQLGQGLQRLLEAWQPVVQQPRLRAEARLFDGRAELTWGWREGARGLAGPPVLRALALLDLAASLDLQLLGQVEYAGARAQLRLRVEGQARLEAQLERLRPEPGLLETMAGGVLRWRWPVSVEADPVAEDSGVVFSEIGPCTGAVTGSLGLRPSAQVGGAWEWHATLLLEPVSARVVVHDPLLGQSESRMALLGSVNLLDWSLV